VIEQAFVPMTSTNGSATQWARGDLNPHALIAHWHLKPACLPFHHSPGSPGRHLQGNSKG
jgi:hypothetical protein